MYKKYLILAAPLFLSFGLVSNIFAATDYPDTDPSQLSYVFRLYYDNGQLVADRDFEFKYDIITEKFVPETLTTGFPYRGEIVNLNGGTAATFQFDPRHGDTEFLKGKISVKAPYVSDGQKVIFYNNQNQVLLTIFVQDSSFCNDDGSCNSNVGEDAKTCPFDCKTATPLPTISTEPSAGGTSGVLKSIIYLIIGLAVGGGFWWWRRRKNDNTISQYTPPIPPLNPVS